MKICTQRLHLAVAITAFATVLLAAPAHGALFFDDYSTNTSANYTQQNSNGTFTHNTSAQTLDYSRSDASAFLSNSYLVKADVFSLADLDVFTVSGEITYSTSVTNAQAALLFAAGNGDGGFMVYRHAATNNWRLTAIATNLFDATGDFATIGSFQGLGTYDITVDFDRSGGVDAIVSVSIIGPDSTISLTNHTITGGATAGGNQIGWWVRNGSDGPTQSFGYLSAIPEPSSLLLFGALSTIMLVRRRRC